MVALRVIIKRRVAIITLAAIFITLLMINVLALSPPVKSAENAHVGSTEEAQEEAQAPPRTYEARLASPPMYVDAWREFSGQECVIMGPYFDPVWSSWLGDFSGGHGHATRHIDGVSFFMHTWCDLVVDEYPGVGHVLTIDSPHEYEYYDPVSRWSLFGSFYILASVAGEATFSFKYNLTVARSFIKYNRTETADVPYQRLYGEYKLAMVVSLHVVDRLDTDEPRPGVYPWDHAPWGPTRGAVVEAYDHRHYYPTMGTVRYEKVIDVSMGTFSVRWNFEGEAWIGIRIAIVVGLRTEVFPQLGEEYAQTIMGLINTTVEGTVWDFRLTCDYSKPAFTKQEAGYVDPGNHTATASAGWTVNHKIRYVVGYSATWDAFNFTIGAPDYERYKSDIYYTGRSDGILSGDVTTSSPDYLRRLAPMVCPRTQSRTVRVYAETHAMGMGNATLTVYDAYGEEQASIPMDFVGPCALLAEVREHVSCRVNVCVLDEDGNPVANATVMAWDAYDPATCVSGTTDEDGRVSLVLPHQGFYIFKAFKGLHVGFRRKIVLPTMAIRFVGPCPLFGEGWGDLEVGFVATGHPDGPSENDITIKFGLENTLRLEGFVLALPFPLRLVQANVSITIRDASGRVVAELMAPGEVHLNNGTYRLEAQDTVEVDGTEYVLLGWLMADSPFANEIATVGLDMDRRAIAIYGPESLLGIASLVDGEVEIGGGAALVLKGPSDAPEPYDRPYGHDFLIPSVMDFLARIDLLGIGAMPLSMALPKGVYLLATYEQVPENYTFAGWEGADLALGTLPSPTSPIDVVRYVYGQRWSEGVYVPPEITISLALVGLTADRQVEVIYELEEDRDPLLTVKAMFTDGGQLPGVPIEVFDPTYYATGEGFYKRAETPCRGYVDAGYYLVRVPKRVEAGGGLAICSWENVDAVVEENSTHITFLVNCAVGHFIRVYYSHVLNSASAGPALGRAQALADLSHQGLMAPEAPRLREWSF